VIEPATKDWTTVCELTDRAMGALVGVERALMAVDDSRLNPLEFRALLWARCSLATLYGIRADEAADEALADVDAFDLDWASRLG
jgi:hypothetical protein